jgi:hypothetical protein
MAATTLDLSRGNCEIPSVESFGQSTKEKAVTVAGAPDLPAKNRRIPLRRRLPPLPLRLLPGGANQFPAGSLYSDRGTIWFNCANQ